MALSLKESCFREVLLNLMLIVMLIGQEIRLIDALLRVLLYFFCCSPISSSAKKQTTVYRSSTEAEYRSLAQTTGELYWIRQLLCDLHIFLHKPPVLWCDNAYALALAKNLVFHARTKHVEIDYHFIREKVVRGDLQVQFMSSTSQLADLFTKPLSSVPFQQFSAKLLKDTSSV